jgi:crotonobetainyl-CoA:carnitine CoA-transferase CaiB-like acyl-CoA transferase
VQVVEVDAGMTFVGAGMAACLPGALLRDLGADVVRVQSSGRSTLDAGVPSERAWNHGKRIVEVDLDEVAGQAAQLVADADVLLLTGPEDAIEGRGLSWPALAPSHPRLVVVRTRPSADAGGPVPDVELLVAARAGLPTQVRHHEAGRPAFPEVPVAQAGAAVSATVGALARLYEREATGRGGWAETSLHDGVAALLPMILGRVADHSPATRLLWEQQGPDAGLAYSCADGAWLQLWFGARGAYEAFLEVMEDEPSEGGYQADLTGGAMTERSARWAARFETRPRAWWLDAFADRPFRCEPVLRRGELLADAHAREVGLSIDIEDHVAGPAQVVGPVLQVTGGAAAGRPHATGPLLAGLRVLDLSAYLAGPVAPLVLAELGADVIKVEPLAGDAHRGMHPMYAAGNRGKRTVALDLKSPAAGEVLGRLFGWADVVHHNSRLGLAEVLGYDEARVHEANPGVVYSFASGFGETGPRASLAANDHLMQALSGLEAAQGGEGNAPTFLAWGAIDVAAGWLAACGILAGLYARRRTSTGQSVATSLLGAAMWLTSGAVRAGDHVVAGPTLDAGQDGYGAAYRLYACAEGTWVALVVTDQDAWDRLVEIVGVADLPPSPPPLRTAGDGPQPAERMLAGAFATRTAGEWVAALRPAGVGTEVVEALDRSAFSARFLDDPVNRRLGRVTTYEWGDLGTVEQPRFPPRFGPDPAPGASAFMAGPGEHTTEIVELLGFDDAQVSALRDAGTIPPAPQRITAE